MTDRAPLTTVAEQERERAFTRFAQLQPHLEDGVPLPRVAKDAGLSLRTAQRWVRQYRHQGLAGLARPPRKDRDTHRLPTALVQLIEGLALRTPRLTAAAIQRQVAPLAVQQGWPTPGYAAVYAVIRALDPALRILAHEGAAAYRETFDLLYRREATCPNEIWQADHTQLDLWVRDGQGKAVRPWLTVILDDFSRAVAAYRVSVQAPSALQTALTLREAIWRKAEPGWQVCGIPGTFYTDHGSDFTSHHLEQVGADLKMVLVFSEVGKPRGRGRIERFFLTVNQLFLSPLPGYTPRGSTPPPKSTLPLTAFEERLHRFLVSDYNQRVHSETGEPPQLRWEAGGFLPNLPDSLEQLDLLLLTVAKSRKVQQDGIHFEGLRYLDTTLAAYVGESVVIRYDPKDLSEIRVFYQDQFLCRPVCQELDDQVVSLKDIKQARTARRRELGDTLRQRTKLVETLRGAAREEPPEAAPAPVTPRLKRYFND